MTDTANPASTTSGDQRLGERLRSLRRQRKLRLRDLAARIPCSEGLISKIERGRVTPSLKVLHGMASALDVSIASLFAEPRDAVVQRAGERPVIALAGHGHERRIKLEQLIAYTGDTMLEANIHIVEPGAQSAGDISHYGEEIGYVLEGRLELWVEDNRYELEAGDSFHFPSEARHRYGNPGSCTTRILWVNTPPTF